MHSLDNSKLISINNIFAAWNTFKRGKLTKRDVMHFERYLEDNLFQLQEDLQNQTYRHGGYKTFHIFDPKHRVISKAKVRDRLVHHIIFEKLYSIFNPGFIYHSYSSRIGKGTHLAVQELNKCLRKISRNYNHPAYVLKCDVKKFFNSVSHQKLLQLIQCKIKDNHLLSLVEEIVGSFVVVDKIGQGGGFTRIADWKCHVANFRQHILKRAGSIC